MRTIPTYSFNYHKRIVFFIWAIDTDEVWLYNILYKIKFKNIQILYNGV